MMHGTINIKYKLRVAVISLAFFFFLLFPSVSTSVSPCGTSRDIYSVYNLGYYVTMLLCSCSTGVLKDSGLVLVGLAACLRWLWRTWRLRLCLCDIPLSGERGGFVAPLDLL